MSAAEVLDHEPKGKNRPSRASAGLPPAPPASILNTERLQEIVDAMIAPIVDGKRFILPLPSVLPGVTPLSDEINPDTGRPLPLPCCEIDPVSGEVVYGSGPVVTERFTQHLESKIIPKLEQQVHRALQFMSRSLDAKGRGVVDDRAKVIPPVPDHEWT